jgi:hypothetical protein
MGHLAGVHRGAFDAWHASVSIRPGLGPARAGRPRLIRRLSRPLISLLLGLMLVPLSATSVQAANAVDSASYGVSVSVSLLGLPLTLAKLPVSEFRPARRATPRCRSTCRDC